MIGPSQAVILAVVTSSSSKMRCAFFVVLGVAFAQGNVVQEKYAVAPKELSPIGKMPVIGLGTWQAKGEDVEGAIDAALEAGYRHIDTAYVYDNEKSIGNALKRWFDGGKIKREDLFIVSKLPSHGNRAEDVETSIKKSLADLQLEYLDLYLIHTPFGYHSPSEAKNGKTGLDKSTDLLAIWKEMEAQVDAGRTKAIGVSNFNSTQISRILEKAKIKPTNLQVELHAYHQQLPLVEFCKKHGITVTAYSPLGSPGLGKFLSQHGLNVTIPNILHNPVVEEVAKKHSKSGAQIVLRHGIQKGLIVIPKSTNPKRIKENLNVFDFELDTEDMQKLNNLDKGEAGKLVDFGLSEGIKEHPEYPWP